MKRSAGDGNAGDRARSTAGVSQGELCLGGGVHQRWRKRDAPAGRQRHYILIGRQDIALDEGGRRTGQTQSDRKRRRVGQRQGLREGQGELAVVGRRGGGK